jgi:hypothetical protein
MAHAWVECAGTVISEGSQEEAIFSAFENLPGTH